MATTASPHDSAAMQTARDSVSSSLVADATSSAPPNPTEAWSVLDVLTKCLKTGSVEGLAAILDDDVHVHSDVAPLAHTKEDALSAYGLLLGSAKNALTVRNAMSGVDIAALDVERPSLPVAFGASKAVPLSYNSHIVIKINDEGKIVSLHDTASKLKMKPGLLRVIPGATAWRLKRLWAKSAGDLEAGLSAEDLDEAPTIEMPKRAFPERSNAPDASSPGSNTAPESVSPHAVDVNEATNVTAEMNPLTGVPDEPWPILEDTQIDMPL